MGATVVKGVSRIILTLCTLILILIEFCQLHQLDDEGTNAVHLLLVLLTIPEWQNAQRKISRALV